MTPSALPFDQPSDPAADCPPAGDRAARRRLQRSARRAATAPPVVPRLRGSTAILDYLLTGYGSTGGLPVGALALLLLDASSRLCGTARVRDVEPDLGPAEQTELLRETAHVLRHGHPRGRGGRALLLVVVRDGLPTIAEPEMRWWSALYRACGDLGLDAADVLTLTPAGWHTLRAGTSGTEPIAVPPP